jgi:hypothetical protein
MSHTYLLDTYKFIERRQEEIGRRMVNAGDDDWKSRHYAAGRIQALCDLERFLRTNFDAKLPRRLRSCRR